MGQAIIAEALAKGHQITGATEAPNCPALGRALCDFGVNSETKICTDINTALQDADIFISFTTPAADLINIPTAVALNKRIILGTTGFTPDQHQKITATMAGKVPAVFSPNYSVGINILFKLAEQLKAFPQGYDFSINEIHHIGKVDAPSGTAKKLGEIITDVRGYTKTISGREGISPRQPNELEVTTLRAGGVAGIHSLIIAGSNEMLRIEHTAFSRDVFAQGAVYAAEWLSQQSKPQIYSMADVLGLN
jgi:4-hydroxy-tetrahydrodipicolinate reductase